MPCRPNKTACECGWICIISLMGNISNGSLKVIGPAVKPGALGRLAVFISPAEGGVLKSWYSLGIGTDQPKPPVHCFPNVTFQFRTFPKRKPPHKIPHLPQNQPVKGKLCRNY